MSIEVWQRRDPGHLDIVRVGDERQPQPQLREAHSGWCEIDAEQRAGEDVALHGEQGPVSGRASEAHHLVQRSQQERT